MSKKQFRSQASSSRVVSGASLTPDRSFVGSSFGASPTFGTVSSSKLSYIFEPPDLSSISDPNVVVLFKNALKKDSTTKAKALEELQAYSLTSSLNAHGVEDSILEAWIQIYPRTSIDSSRRVRQLSHLVQGQISVSCGKRIAKYMPRTVGSWVAGLYDNDKLAARGAQDAFHQVFSTEEKRRNLWKVYQSNILEYCRDAILKETIHTLSDERVTSPDDAQAKHARVVGTALLAITHTLEVSSKDELIKHGSLYEEILRESRIWKLASNVDAFVRRGVCRLLIVALDEQEQVIDMSALAETFLSASLDIDHMGSALDYMTALSKLTQREPGVWTLHYTGSGKKSARRKLCQLLKRGSQGAASKYWSEVHVLLRHVPSSILVLPNETQVRNAEDAHESKIPVLEAIHQGLSLRHESYANRIVGWSTYLNVSDRIFELLPNPGDVQKFTREMLIPLIEQFVRPLPNGSQWTTIRGSEGLQICVQAILKAMKGARNVLQDEWARLSALIVEDIQTLLPEQSKEYTKSQNDVAAEVERWYSVQAEVMKSMDMKSMFIEPSISFINATSNVLKSRNGKPFGAAAALESAARILPGIILEFPVYNKVELFVQNDLPSLLLSPSSPYLINLLDHLRSAPYTDQTYLTSLQTLLAATDSPEKSTALQSLISTSAFPLLAKDRELRIFLQQSSQKTLNGASEHWPVIEAVLSNAMAPADMTDQLLAGMTESLSLFDQREAGLQGLEFTVKHNTSAVRNFSTSPGYQKLLSTLLTLAEASDDELSRRAQVLSSAIDTSVASNSGLGQTSRTLIEIIHQGISRADSHSLSINSLVNQAQKILHNTSEGGLQQTVSELLPNHMQWSIALDPIFAFAPNVSLSMINPLGGAIHGISHDFDSDASVVQGVERDASGFSPALRTAWYTVELIRAANIFEYVLPGQSIILLHQLALIAQLAGDNVSIQGSNELWDQYEADVEFELIDFVSATQALIASWLKSTGLQDVVGQVLEQLAEDSKGQTPRSYYSGRAYVSMKTELLEMQPQNTTDSDPMDLKVLGRSTDIIYASTHLMARAHSTAIGESQGLLKLCNELIADQTGHDIGLRQLIYLNAIIQERSGDIAQVPQQRLLFFVRHVVSQLAETSTPSAITTEALKVFKVVLPLIKDIYGSFWKEILKNLTRVWSSPSITAEDEIPLLDASIRLCLTIAVFEREGNDDLQESWIEEKDSVIERMLGLMDASCDLSDDSHQPRSIVNHLIARMLSKLKPHRINCQAKLFSILASRSSTLQQVGYELLHREIPSNQEQISLDAALEPSYEAKLPEELLSLILTAPSLDSFSDWRFHRKMPVPLRSYLLSWKLVFDHFTGSSYKVKSDYVRIIEKENYLKSLLDTVFDFLISSRSKPVDASKFSVQTYTPSSEEISEKDAQWLTIHLYYLSLKHLPTLSKAWWRDCEHRALVIAVEPWTEKYISSYVIADELDTVAIWIPTEKMDDHPLNVKILPKSREITAGFEVDEQTMQIAIKLPPTYPLHQVTVEGVNRVGVDTKKWQSWLITTQGVINFSNGSIIDGLLAWKKNVTGALKGQTECAICYSIISADKQLPNKKCGICKNLFHSGCLFRWFKSSNSSSCPLCRNAFNYG